MIDLSMTFDRMKNEVNVIKCAFSESISPVKNPGKFDAKLEYLSENYLSLLLKHVDSSYKKYDLHNSLIELQSNALMHGNNFDQDSQINIKTIYGKNRFIIQIKDSGEGFNYREIVKKFSLEQIYFNYFGFGFETFNNHENIIVSYEGKGNVSNLMFRAPEQFFCFDNL